MATPPTPKIVALRIELQEVVPLVWRRVLVAEQWTLASLHHYLQWVLGWTDSHAHEFEVGDGLIAPDWWIQEAGSEEEAGRYRDERRVSVAAVVSELGIRGEHNVENVMAGCLAARLAGAEPDAIANGVRTFPGVEHRIAFAGKLASLAVQLEQLREQRGPRQPVAVGG